MSSDALGPVLQFRGLVFCFQQASSRTGADFGGQHGPEVAVSTLRSAWKDWELGDNAKWGCSDSAPGAVKTSRLLKLSEKRCVVHVLIIPVTRTLKGKKPRGARQVPPSGYDNHPAPEYLRALESMRAVCLWSADRWIATWPAPTSLWDFGMCVPNQEFYRSPFLVLG